MNENNDVNKKIRNAIIEKCFNKEVNNEKREDCLKKLKAILDSRMLGNKFVTIYSFEEEKFIFTHKLSEALGYEEKDFTLSALYNLDSSLLKITFEEDVVHLKRCDKVICKMITKKYFVDSFDDCYEIIFRVRHAKGNILTVRRSCYMFHIDEDNIALSHIDIWEVIPDTNFTHVNINILSKNPVQKNLAFYNFNLEQIGIKLTERQYQILLLKDNRKINKEIALILNITTKTLDNHINKLMKNLNDYCEMMKMNFRIYNTSDLLYFTKLYGLYPKPFFKTQHFLKDTVIN